MSIVGASFLPPLAIACLYYLTVINAILAVFNLFPGLPLDGGRILKSIIWRISNDELLALGIAVFCGKALGILIIVAGGLIVFFTRDLIGGLWLSFIGWFLFNAAGSQISAKEKE